MLIPPRPLWTDTGVPPSCGLFCCPVPEKICDTEKGMKEDKITDPDSEEGERGSEPW